MTESGTGSVSTAGTFRALERLSAVRGHMTWNSKVPIIGSIEAQNLTRYGVQVRSDDSMGRAVKGVLQSGLPPAWSGTEVKLDGSDLLIMKESDIMGIIE